MAEEGKKQEPEKGKEPAERTAREMLSERETIHSPPDSIDPFSLQTKNVSIDDLSCRLSDRRMPAVQRQAIAASIGRTLGNRFLQRAVSLARASQEAPEAEESSETPDQSSAAYESLFRDLLAAIRSQKRESIRGTLNAITSSEELDAGEKEQLQAIASASLRAFSAADTNDSKGMFKAMEEAHEALGRGLERATGVSVDDAQEALSDLISLLSANISQQNLEQALAAKDSKAILQAWELAQMGGVPEEVEEEIQNRAKDGLGAIALDKVIKATEERDIKGILEGWEFAMWGLAQEDVAEEIEVKAYEGLEVVHRSKMDEAINAGDAEGIMKLVESIQLGLVQGEAAHELIAQAAAALRKLGRNELADAIEVTEELPPEIEPSSEPPIPTPKTPEEKRPKPRKKKLKKTEPPKKKKPKTAYTPQIRLEFNNNTGKGSLWLDDRLYVRFRVLPEEPRGVEGQQIQIRMNPSVDSNYDSGKKQLIIYLMLPANTRWQAGRPPEVLFAGKLNALGLEITVGGMVELRQQNLFHLETTE